jgi:trimethylamine---corrinoid protein Co-methyltransferase
MADFELGFSPKLTFLSDGDKRKIYSSALDIIEKTGQTLHHEGALKLLSTAGCKVEDKKVKIPRALVEKAIASAPKNIPIFNRKGELVMDLGGRRSYFGTGSDLMWSVESETMIRHKTSLEDIKTAARVCDALPNIDFIMSFAHPHELPPKTAYLASFEAMATSSIKPIVNTAEGRTDLAAMWEISRIIRGGEKELREKPYWIQYAEPISPLKHIVSSVDKLIFCGQTFSPVIYSPAPIAGSTALMTIAGHVVQGLSECLFGLVIHQLTAPGAPFLMGMGPAVLDMSTSQCSYNAPEYLLSYMAIVEMSKYLDLPNWGYAGTSDAQIPDMQAAWEAGLETFMAAMAGSNLNHDVGYLDFGLTGSLEMVVVMDEVIDQVRRMQKGIPVTDDTCAVEAIVKGVGQGQFLTNPHTLKHLRSVQWRPRLLTRPGYDKWVLDGSMSLLDRARGRLSAILSIHRPEALNPETAAAVSDVVSRFQAV